MGTESVPETIDLTLALRHIDKTVQNGVYVLLDPQPYLQDPINLRLIREIALSYNKTPRTLVFVSPRLELPSELVRMSARFELALLDAAGVMQIIHEEVDLLSTPSAFISARFAAAGLAVPGLWTKPTTSDRSAWFTSPSPWASPLQMLPMPLPLVSS
jgi:hypothetical protein